MLIFSRCLLGSIQWTNQSIRHCVLHLRSWHSMTVVCLCSMTPAWLWDRAGGWASWDYYIWMSSDRDWRRYILYSTNFSRHTFCKLPHFHKQFSWNSISSLGTPKWLRESNFTVYELANLQKRANCVPRKFSAIWYVLFVHIIVSMHITCMCGTSQRSLNICATCEHVWQFLIIVMSMFACTCISPKSVHLHSCLCVYTVVECLTLLASGSA